MVELPEKLIAVSDTGPLISAFQCNRIDLLWRYFVRIHLPPPVMTELEQHGARDEVQQLLAQDLFRVEYLSAQEATQAKQIAKQIASFPSTKIRDHTHHLPEAQAIVLMQRPNLRADRILLEEEAARQIADNLNIPITGFIGVLLLACADGHLSPKEMQDLLETCRQQGTRYSNLLVAEAVKRCREVSTQ